MWFAGLTISNYQGLTWQTSNWAPHTRLGTQPIHHSPLKGIAVNDKPLWLVIFFFCIFAFRAQVPSFLRFFIWAFAKAHFQASLLTSPNFGRRRGKLENTFWTQYPVPLHSQPSPQPSSSLWVGKTAGVFYSGSLKNEKTPISVPIHLSLHQCATPCGNMEAGKSTLSPILTSCLYHHSQWLEV